MHRRWVSTRSAGSVLGLAFFGGQSDLARLKPLNVRRLRLSAGRIVTPICGLDPRVSPDGEAFPAPQNEGRGAASQPLQPLIRAAARA